MRKNSLCFVLFIGDIDITYSSFLILVTLNGIVFFLKLSFFSECGVENLAKCNVWYSCAHSLAEGGSGIQERFI